MSQSAHESTPVSQDPNDKVTILPGALDDLSAATYCILNEDHTLGNLLRWMVMQNPLVEFCGYSAPHPSEDKIHLRIQMYDGKSSLQALHEALDNLEEMTEAILEKYQESLDGGDYERPEELSYDFESVNDRLWAEKEAAGLGSREEFEREKREKANAERELLEKAKAGKGLRTKGKPIKVGR